MKINTITCHHVYNYGATLQAYALQHYLEQQGHEVEIINYRPFYQRGQYDLFYVIPGSKGEKWARKCKLIAFLFALYRNRVNFRTWGRKKSFGLFNQQFLKTTSKQYNTLEELQNKPPQADMYIAGSDQIWNPELPNGQDGSFFCDFGGDNIKRYSYAASFGVNNIADSLLPPYQKFLQKFNKISVREKSGLNILNMLHFKGIQVVDPVFLLSKEEWIENLQLSRTAHENYIMVYDFHHNNDNLKELVLKLAHNERLKIYSVNDILPLGYADRNISNAGPKEFLNYLLNAQYVVSSSFHATSFSIIFNKSFGVFGLKEQQNSSRMTDLLQLLGLEERFSPQNIETLQADVDWNLVKSKLSISIKKSKDYLSTL